METVRVVRGKRKWKKDFAHLSIISSPGLLPALFGPRAENILMDIYLSEKNLFFYNRWLRFFFATGEHQNCHCEKASQNSVGFHVKPPDLFSTY